MYSFRGNMAERFGINAAVVAEYLFAGEDDLQQMNFTGKEWFRCSKKQINIENPFLTIDQIDYAISKLRDNGVIRSKQIAKSGFDRTNWYTFTEYGMKLMLGRKEDQDE